MSCGKKRTGLVSNGEDGTAASWAGAGALGVLDIQKVLYGHEVLYPTHRNLIKSLGEGQESWRW